MNMLWARLLNSDWHDHRGSGAREDRLGNDDWLKSFLEQAGWPQDRLPDEREREALRQLRRLMRSLLEAFRTEGVIPPEGVEALNRILDGAPVVRRLQGRSVAVVPVADGIKRLLGEIAFSFARLLAEGERARVKICANPDCGWVIYDESRNLSRRWCDASECGNLIKVRQHRQRKREGR